MKTIKIELEIDLSSATQIQALSAVMLAIGNHQVESPVEKPIFVEKVKTTKPTFVPQEKIVMAPVEEAKEELENTIEETIEKFSTLEEIREVLGKKVTDHREKIKAELTRLEAKNVSVLNPSFYNTFKTFLDRL